MGWIFSMILMLGWAYSPASSKNVDALLIAAGLFAIAGAIGFKK